MAETRKLDHNILKTRASRELCDKWQGEIHYFLPSIPFAESDEELELFQSWEVGVRERKTCTRMRYIVRHPQTDTQTGYVRLHVRWTGMVPPQNFFPDAILCQSHVCMRPQYWLSLAEDLSIGA
jgi:hypothetical protein